MNVLKDERPTAAGTLENAESKRATLKSPGQNKSKVMKTADSYQSTLTENNVVVYEQEEEEDKGGVHDMLRKYQQKYRKQKEETIKQY